LPAGAASQKLKPLRIDAILHDVKRLRYRLRNRFKPAAKEVFQSRFPAFHPLLLSTEIFYQGGICGWPFSCIA
jgi:hypothetical protein